jgi:uncharacterized protein YkwD
MAGNSSVSDVSYEAVGLINSFRAQNGLGPVSVDSAVIEAARYQAVAMASRDVLSHEVAGDFTTRMNNAGFTYATATENVGAADRTVADSINAWIRSPHHRENMLMREAKYMGMIRASAPGSRYRTYWALILTSAQAGSGPKIVYSNAEPGKGKAGTPFENDGVQIFFTQQ